jgi:hypothetical protein
MPSTWIGQALFLKLPGYLNLEVGKFSHLIESDEYACQEIREASLDLIARQVWVRSYL